MGIGRSLSVVGGQRFWDLISRPVVALPISVAVLGHVGVDVAAAAAAAAAVVVVVVVVA